MTMTASGMLTYPGTATRPCRQCSATATRRTLGPMLNASTVIVTVTCARCQRSRGSYHRDLDDLRKQLTPAQITRITGQPPHQPSSAADDPVRPAETDDVTRDSEAVTPKGDPPAGREREQPQLSFDAAFGLTRS